MENFDYARIRKQFDKYWLFLGNWRHTSEGGIWVYEKGNERNWPYISWKVVANGDTWNELIESAKEYFRISEMTMIEYISELTGIDFGEYEKLMVNANQIRELSKTINKYSVLISTGGGPWQ